MGSLNIKYRTFPNSFKAVLKKQFGITKYSRTNVKKIPEERQIIYIIGQRFPNFISVTRLFL